MLLIMITKATIIALQLKLFYLGAMGWERLWGYAYFMLEWRYKNFLL